MGHIRLLHYARSLGDKLVVGINSDASAARLKGPTRPIIPASERLEILMALKPVDQVIIFEEDTPTALIASLRPGVLCKGPECKGTQIPGATVVRSYGGRVEIPDWSIEHSTTDIVDRICKAAKISESTGRCSAQPTLTTTAFS